MTQSSIAFFTQQLQAKPPVEHSIAAIQTLQYTLKQSNEKTIVGLKQELDQVQHALQQHILASESEVHNNHAHSQIDSACQQYVVCIMRNLDEDMNSTDNSATSTTTTTIQDSSFKQLHLKLISRGQIFLEHQMNCAPQLQLSCLTRMLESECSIAPLQQCIVFLCADACSSSLVESLCTATLQLQRPIRCVVLYHGESTIAIPSHVNQLCQQLNSESKSLLTCTSCTVASLPSLCTLQQQQRQFALISCATLTQSGSATVQPSAAGVLAVSILLRHFEIPLHILCRSLQFGQQRDQSILRQQFRTHRQATNKLTQLEQAQ